MSQAFEILSTALDEVIEDKQSNQKKLKRHVRTIQIDPVQNYTAIEVKNIRHQAGLTQALLAKYLGVSKKTIEAWESGRTTPSGPSSRLLGLIKENKITITG